PESPPGVASPDSASLKPASVGLGWKTWNCLCLPSPFGLLRSDDGLQRVAQFFGLQFPFHILVSILVSKITKTAVQQIVRAGDEAGLIRAQEQRERSHFLRLAHTADG